jgi:hypothetical protein
MNVKKLNEFKKGWFVGNFNPSLIKTNDVEVGIKKYKCGDYENKHYHKLATEITIIISGKVSMNGNIYTSDDVIVINPLESVDFLVLEDTISTVVKFPGVNNDKYEGEYNND